VSEEIVCGIHALESVLRHNPQRIQQLYVSDRSRNPRLEPLLALAAAGNIETSLVTRQKLDRLAGISAHQGVVARCTARTGKSDSELRWDACTSDTVPFLLALDGVQDPHNLGACIRTLDGAGGQGVIIPKDRAAPITPVVHRAASGALETIELYRVTNLVRTLQQLKQECGLWVYGTSDQAEHTIYELDLRQPFVLVLGTEGKGMRRLVAEQCDQLASIPMLGSVSSLNVSVAAGVCCYEALRQRSQP
jgi:23S rRNA (guanosine2251-2'-O)-methyltransferase